MDEYQETPLSVEQCKELLTTIGKMLSVKAALISTRLLSRADKDDILTGKISIESLITAVEVWKKAGMPDYANAKLTPYVPKYELPMSRYRGNGV